MKNQNKNKSLKIKNKIILPLATVLSASSIALVSLFNTTQNVNNNTLVSLANDVSSNSKSISSNASQKNNLIGPHELFYLSQKLDSSVNVWDDSQNNENSTKLDYKGREIYELLQNGKYNILLHYCQKVTILVWLFFLLWLRQRRKGVTKRRKV